MKALRPRPLIRTAATLYLGVPEPEIVNAELANTRIFGQSYDPGATCAIDGECDAGVFSFTATFCNTNSPGGDDLVGLTSRTASLSAHAALVSRDVYGNGNPVPGGAGSEQSFVIGTLVPEGCEDITYEIGLAQRKGFSFYVDLYGNLVATSP